MKPTTRQRRSRSPKVPPASKKGPAKEPAKEKEPAMYFFRLYVTGTQTRSRRAIANITRLCEEYLPGQYKLEIIDIYQQPELARGQQLVAAPTLIKELPAPLRRFIGDISNLENLLLKLDIRSTPAS